MEPEGSLPYSEHPATCPYPQPDRSSTMPPIPPLRFILILSSHLRLGFPSGSFSQVYPLKPWQRDKHDEANSRSSQAHAHVRACALTRTHPQQKYVKLIAFARQQWFPNASYCYTYIDCLFFFFPRFCDPYLEAFLVIYKIVSGRAKPRFIWLKT